MIQILTFVHYAWVEEGDVNKWPSLSKAVKEY